MWRTYLITLMVSAGLAAAGAPSSLSMASDVAARAARGKKILQERCSRCHSVEASGESPLVGAPPMRDVYARYAPRELTAELSEGMVSRHKEMPQIDFSDEDVAAIMAYLYALTIAK
jgi:mono/diheme cytochrome c family protein